MDILGVCCSQDLGVQDHPFNKPEVSKQRMKPNMVILKSGNNFSAQNIFHLVKCKSMIANKHFLGRTTFFVIVVFLICVCVCVKISFLFRSNGDINGSLR